MSGAFSTVFLMRIFIPSGLIPWRMPPLGDDRGLAGRRDHRQILGPGARPSAQARHQAGRPAAEQSQARSLGSLRHLGSGSGRIPHRPHRGDGLDRLRRRRAGHPGAQAGHGRATPLVWLSVLKDELKNARSDYEDACLRRLAEVLPAGVRVTILAGFADTKLFDFLGELGFDYVIRLKGNTRVGAVDGTTRPAADWIG